MSKTSRHLTALFITGLLLAFGAAASAQQQCGHGLPCGAVPWILPDYPDLSSPTPVQPSSSSGLVPTVVPAPTSAGGQLDTSPLDDQVATLSGMLYATPLAAQNPDGSYNNPDMDATQEAELSASAGVFFGYVRGLSSVSFGVLTPLVLFAVTAFGLIFTLKIATFAIPVFVVLFGFFRKIISAILDFIPL